MISAIETVRAREGFHDPLYCPRGRTDCKSLSQIIGAEHRSFICCGENDGAGVSVPTDHYRVCHKTEDGVDVMMNHDQRDLSHMAAVYSWALAAVLDVEAGHKAERVLHQQNAAPQEHGRKEEQQVAVHTASPAVAALRLK